MTNLIVLHLSRGSLKGAEPGGSGVGRIAILQSCKPLMSLSKGLGGGSVFKTREAGKGQG